MGAARLARSLATVVALSLLPGRVGAADVAPALRFETVVDIEAWAQARFAQAGREAYRFSRSGKEVLAIVGHDTVRSADQRDLRLRPDQGDRYELIVHRAKFYGAAVAKEEPAGVAFHTEVPILSIPWAGVQVGFESVPNVP